MWVALIRMVKRFFACFLLCQWAPLLLRSLCRPSVIQKESRSRQTRHMHIGAHLIEKCDWAQAVLGWVLSLPFMFSTPWFSCYHNHVAFPWLFFCNNLDFVLFEPLSVPPVQEKFSEMYIKKIQIIYNETARETSSVFQSKMFGICLKSLLLFGNCKVPLWFRNWKNYTINSSLFSVLYFAIVHQFLCDSVVWMWNRHCSEIHMGFG